MTSRSNRIHHSPPASKVGVSVAFCCSACITTLISKRINLLLTRDQGRLTKQISELFFCQSETACHFPSFCTREFLGIQLFAVPVTVRPQGVTKLEFVTEDYHYPGAYDTDGKVILEKGAPVSNELHRTEEQKERACS